MFIMGSWPVVIIRAEHPRYTVLYVDSINENGEVRSRVFCPYSCPLDEECPLWRKPICASKAVVYIVPEPEESIPEVFFSWEEARDFALEKARQIRESEEALYLREIHTPSLESPV